MRRDERGANLVEAALVVPILVLILAGIADIGRVFYSYIAIANAAREGARTGARLSCYPGSTSEDQAQRANYRQEIEDAIFDELSGSDVDTAIITYTISPDPIALDRCPVGAEEVVVVVTYPETMILPAFVGTGTINLTARASMSRVGQTGV